MLREINKKNRKGVSMMISYVILISIAIAMSIGVLAFLNAYANVEPLPECNSETSLMLDDYDCSGNLLRLHMKNNGFFNVSGYTLLVGNTTQRIPIYTLVTDDGISDHGLGSGHLVFDHPLGPGKNETNSFNMGSDYQKDIKILQIQPFILSEKGDKVPCENVVILQEVDCAYVTLP